MEAALLSGFIKVILPKLFSLVDEKCKLHKSVKGGIRFLERELNMIVGSIDDELSTQSEDHGAVWRLWIEELRELAHDIEDCIDTLIYRNTREQQSSLFRRTIRSPNTLHTNLQLAQLTQRLKKSAEEAHERKQRYTVAGQPSSATKMDEPSSSAFHPRILDADLVGVDAPREELLEQLAEAGEGQPKRLKVISIVGFCGLGKTVLAAEVYNREIGSKKFEMHGWFCAAHKGPREVLVCMLRELGSDAHSCPGTADVGQLCVDLKQQLDKKRYFIVIDDIQTEDQWKTIKQAFPADKDVSSRIIVTTTIQSVANACSSVNGYVHKMGRLDKKFSKQLFSKKACPEKYSNYKQPDSEEIMKKCDGQPLALVTIGEFLQTKGWPTGPTCEDFCNQLCYHLENDKTFEKIRQVLKRNYTGLPDHAHKACLLYFGIFPSDHPIRRKSLLRRWLAEGFLALNSSSTLDPVTVFNALMDRNIIEPISVSNNDIVKTCQTFGMMHEFILRMSISQNFITLFCDAKIEPKYVRRLSLHNTATDSDCFDSIDLSLVRSLTIFRKASEAVLDFSKYQLLRVLDLEKCDDLKDDRLKDICNLLLLKYLSLGGNATTLPRDIAKLKYLETLDLRRTKVNILPVEVFQLPCLIHLFGKFKLPDKVKPKSEVQEFLSKGKSNLQTLAGFATDGSERFLHLFMGYMNKLRKVKIWCKSSAGTTEWTDLKKAIQQFIQDEKEANIGSHSLSLHFEECSEGFLNSLEGPCYLSSLKLHGNFPALPQFVVALRGLRELCLSSTKLTMGVLEALSNLSYLQYLKLIADDLDKFIIKDQSFPKLLRLCLVLQCPTFPTIEQGALPFLDTLQLLCKDLDGLSDIKIECLKLLLVVTLDPRVTAETREKWENAAKGHPNRPKVFLSNSVDEAESEPTGDSIASKPAESEATEDSIASEGPVQETDIQMLLNQGSGSSSMPKKQNNDAVQSSSNDQLNSAFNNMGLSEVSPALNELSNGMVPSYT